MLHFPPLQSMKAVQSIEAVEDEALTKIKQITSSQVDLTGLIIYG
jgi:hypothetical protein